MSARPLRSPLAADSPIRHRAPILCVDELLESGAEVAACALTVREGPHVQAGSLWEGALVEGIAQTSTLLEDPAAVGAPAAGVGMLVGVRRFVVDRLPRIGERVVFRVQLVRRLGPFLLVDGRATSGDECLAKGELKFYWSSTPEHAAATRAKGT